MISRSPWAESIKRIPLGSDFARLPVTTSLLGERSRRVSLPPILTSCKTPMARTGGGARRRGGRILPHERATDIMGGAASFVFQPGHDEPSAGDRLRPESTAEGGAGAGVDAAVKRGEELDSRRRHREELGARSRGGRKERSWSRGIGEAAA